jgi:hypothetical protein
MLPDIPVELVAFVSSLTVIPVVEWIKVKLLDDKEKRWLVYLISLVYSLMIAIVSSFIFGHSIGEQEGILWTLVFTQGIYQVIWKQLGLQNNFVKRLRDI